MFPGAMPAQSDKQQRKLVKLYKKLDVKDQEALLSFAEFLFSRHSEASDHPENNTQGDAISTEPLSIPRPKEESVIKAIKRLRKTYPMIDKQNVLHPISSLMTAHIMQGKAADKVIDELESLFVEEYNSIKKP